MVRVSTRLPSVSLETGHVLRNEEPRTLVHTGKELYQRLNGANQQGKSLGTTIERSG